MKYVYGFVAWPDHGWNFDKSVYELFKMLQRRVEMEFTEAEFEKFRSGLSHHGLGLREVTRAPFVEPENVS